MNCIIIDDEPLAIQLLEDYVQQIPGLHLLGSFEDVMMSHEVLQNEKVDIIFLDINLPRMNGLDFIKTLHQKYHIILTTAYHQYALEGFELDVTDYLMKPITFERFYKAVNKAMEKKETAPGETDDYFFVKTDNRIERVNFEDILFVEAMANYVIIQTTQKKLITYSSLKNMESFLPEKDFIKVQKSFIVPIRKIDFIEGNDIHIGDKLIPISRNLKDEVFEVILKNKILRKK